MATQNNFGRNPADVSLIQHPQSMVVSKKKPGHYVQDIRNEYSLCGYFGYSKWDGVTEHGLQTMRYFFLTLMVIQFVLNLYVDYEYENIFDFFFYESEWGFVTSMFHMFASIMATNYPDTHWQSTGVISGEVALCFDLLIAPVFWYLIAPAAFPKLQWHGIDLYWRIEMSFVHSCPITCCLLNLILTNYYFLEEDCIITFAGGILYIFADWLGTKVEGHEMYPIVDWKNPVVTIAIFMI